MKELTVTKKVKVLDEYDVVVCGGGPAGWVAAVSAARAGCRVALVERQGYLGGTATAGLVIPISVFYFQGERVVGGIAWEFVEEMEKLGAAQVELPKGHVSVNVEYYKLVSQRMAEENGVKLYTNAVLSDCIVEDGKVTHVVIENKSGTSALAAKCFIDATGDGDLCHFAGIPMLDKPDVQPASLCFVLENVNTETDLLREFIHHDGKFGHGSCVEEIHDYLTPIMEKGGLPKFCGPWFNTLVRGNCLVVNITRAAVDGTDAEALTKAEAQLREDMFAIVEALRQKYEEFRNCEIVWSAANAGIRETRHIKGVYTLTAEDFADGKTFACPAAHSAHPMDIHLPDGSGQILVPLERNCFVPHQTMINETITNVIAAGRCISTEREPYASLRVQAQMMSIGEAAGVMAKLYCEGDVPMAALDEAELARRFNERGFVR